LPLQPPNLDGIERVTHLSVLGITIQSDLRMGEHVSNVVAKASSDMFALKTLKSHGLCQPALSQVCRATLVSRMVYASPAWRGFCSVADLARLDAIERKARRWRLYSDQSPTISNILDKADVVLFRKILGCADHVLHHQLPPARDNGYSLRPRGHDRSLPLKTNLTSKNFIVRMLYSTV
jgi:hypothetical protein